MDSIFVEHHKWQPRGFRIVRKYLGFWENDHFTHCGKSVGSRICHSYRNGHPLKVLRVLKILSKILWVNTFASFAGNTAHPRTARLK